MIGTAIKTILFILLVVVALDVFLECSLSSRSEINIQTGQKRITYRIYSLKVYQKTTDTLLSSYIPTPLIYTNAPAWILVRHHQYMDTMGQVYQLEKVLTELTKSKELQTKIVEGLIRKWQHGYFGRYRTSYDYSETFMMLTCAFYDLNPTEEEKTTMIENLLHKWQEENPNAAAEDYVNNIVDHATILRNQNSSETENTPSDTEKHSNNIHIDSTQS